MRGLSVIVMCVLVACGFDRGGVQLGDDEPAADADPGTPDAVVLPPDATPEPPIDAAVCGADPTPPPDAICPPECTGGCQAGVCAIDCTGTDACRQDTITCPDGWSCAVTCSGDRACERARIQCPALYGCAVSCESSTACTDADVFCGTGACEATCSGGGDSSGLFGGGGGVAAPTVRCGESCACAGCGG
jgi:hypothetical protein